MRKPTKPGIEMLRRLLIQYELTPGGSREQARRAANWYRTGEALEKLEYAISSPAGGGRRYDITPLGIEFLNWMDKSTPVEIKITV